MVNLHFDHFFHRKIDFQLNSFDLQNDGIDLKEKYSLITGIEDKKEFIKPWLIRSSEISIQTTCEIFDITKA